MIELTVKRGWGKTTLCVALSALLQVPILCEFIRQIDIIKQKAKLHKFNIPDPILLSKLNRSGIYRVIIDDMSFDGLMKFQEINKHKLIPVEVVFKTMTEDPDSEEVVVNMNQTM